MDFNKTIERIFGQWTWRHLGIAFALSILALFLIDPIVSKDAKKSEDYRIWRYGHTAENVLHRWLDRNDPRAFLPIDRSDVHQPIFDISWISGSSVSIKQAPPNWRIDKRDAYNLTEVLNKYVLRINNQPVAVHQYLQQGARSSDVHRAFINAANDPNTDLILMPVNTVYVFNDWLGFTTSNRQRAQYLDHPNLFAIDYKSAAAVLSPFEIALNKLKDVNNSFALRTFITKNLNVDKLRSFIGGGGSATGGEILKYWRDWFYPKDIVDTTAPSIQQFAGYRSYMLMQNLDENGFGRQLFRANVKLAAQKNIPTIFYIAPIPRAAQDDKVLVAFLDKMFAALRADIDKYGNQNTLLVTSTAFDTPQPYLHRDMVHLRHAQGLIDALVSIMEQEFDLKMIKQKLEKVYVKPK